MKISRTLLRRYTQWWAHERERLQVAFTVAIEREFWPLVSAHLLAAAPFMRETHNRNLDKDCAAIQELFHAPINTDGVESGFAYFDNALKLEASVYAELGVAHATAMKLMTTDGSKKARARRSSSGIADAGERAAAVEAKMSVWNCTSFFSLTREKRWLIIKDVQRSFKFLCVSEPEAKLRAHDEAKLGRAVATRDHEAATYLNRAVKFKEMDTIVPITSLGALDALKVVFYFSHMLLSPSSSSSFLYPFNR
jgi:hypothetical protein